MTIIATTNTNDLRSINPSLWKQGAHGSLFWSASEIGNLKPVSVWQEALRGCFLAFMTILNALQGFILRP
jgi:hypothetical protein